MKIIANTVVQILGRVLTSGITFLITIIIAANFGAVGYGDFTKVITFVGFFYLISDFGFNAIFLREFKNREWKLLLGLRIIFATALASLAIIIPFFLPSSDNQGFSSSVRLGIFIYSFTILTQAIFTTCNGVFQKIMRYDKSVLAASLGQITTLILAMLLVKTSSLNNMLIAFLTGSIFMAVVALTLVKRESYNIRPGIDIAFIKKLTLFTLPLGATLVFNLVYFRADSFLLTLLRPTTEVGIYGLAFKFFEFPLAIATFFANAIYPVLLENKKRESLNKVIKKYSTVMVLVSISLALALWFVAPLISSINKEFTASIIPFRILILSLPLFFFSSILQWGLIAQGRQKSLALVYFSGMILNIFLNLLFIPSYSFLASSIITGVCEGVVLVLLLILVLKS